MYRGLQKAKSDPNLSQFVTKQMQPHFTLMITKIDSWMVTTLVGVKLMVMGFS